MASTSPWIAPTPPLHWALHASKSTPSAPNFLAANLNWPHSKHSAAPLDLRRIAWDLPLFTTSEFAFITLPPEYSTGSSIMPNKRNPDVIELMRATHASVAAARTEIEQLLSLPSGYHRDLQNSKGAIVRGFKRGLAALELLPALLSRLQWRPDTLRAAIDPGMYATDAAS